MEDFPLARLFRQSPLNSVWEGSGNVMALDILRGYKALPSLLNDIKTVQGADKAFDHYVKALETSIQNFAKEPSSSYNQKSARNLVDRLAIAQMGSVVIRYGDPKVASNFIASRIKSEDTRGVNYGGSHVFSDADCDYILKRNMPVFSK